MSLKTLNPQADDRELAESGGPNGEDPRSFRTLQPLRHIAIVLAFSLYERPPLILLRVADRQPNASHCKLPLTLTTHLTSSIQDHWN